MISAINCISAPVEVGEMSVEVGEMPVEVGEMPVEVGDVFLKFGQMMAFVTNSIRFFFGGVMLKD